MKNILFAVALAISSLTFAQEFQEKHQRVKIYLSETNNLQALANLGLPVEHGIHKRGHFVISDFSVSEIEMAKQAGFVTEVLIEDSKAHFLQQNRNPQLSARNPVCDGGGIIAYETPANFKLGSMGGYLTYQELLDELDAMHAAYPDLITEKANIGSFLTEGTPDPSTTPPIGGNGIKWVKISDNAAAAEGEPQMLYTALHHAREPVSLSQLVFYMWYLLENYGSDPEVTAIVDNTELYFVPCINPDGYLYNQKTDPNGGGFWRKNRNNTYGIDLNRNYDYYINGDPNNNTWGGQGASSSTSSETYHGPSPFSEVETQAIKFFVEEHDFVMAFNNHTSGDLLLYPYGYTDNAPTPENDLFVGISEELVSQNGFDNILSSELYPAAGDSDDFMYGTVNTHDKIYAMTPEIGPSFWPPSSEIIPLSKGMMYHNLTGAKMVNNYAKIEDTAPQFVGDEATVNATFSIKRLGVNGDGNFTVSLNPISSNIVSTGNPVSFTAMDIVEEDMGTIPYTLASGTAAGDDIVYELVVNNGSFDTAISITKKFGNLVSVFEDPGNSVTDNFTNDGWGVTTSSYVSAPSSITDSPSGNYPNNTNETIALSDPIDLTEALGANLTFYAKWEIESNWDYVQVQVSIDGGTNWEAQCGNYTEPANESNGFQPVGEPVYDGFQTDWVLEEIDLSDYLGEEVLVRFQLASDGGTRENGFFFDDLKINIVDESALSTEDFTENIFAVYPNPVKNELNINTSVVNYTIEIFNLQGQLVATFKNLSQSNKIETSSLSQGMYVLKIASEEFSKTFKIVKH